MPTPIRAFIYLGIVTESHCLLAFSEGKQILRTLDTVTSFHGGNFQNIHVFIFKKNMLCGTKLATLICYKIKGSLAGFPARNS